jgi:hypothetical protein
VLLALCLVVPGLLMLCFTLLLPLLLLQVL